MIRRLISEMDRSTTQMDGELNIYCSSGYVMIVEGLDSSWMFVQYTCSWSFSSSMASLLKNNLLHTNPDLSCSISGKVRIVWGKQMKHKRSF